MTSITVVLALLIGASLGLVGGGGAILTVPALVHVLAVIAVNCVAGLVTAAAELNQASMVVTAVFAVLALVGTLVGARTASRARPEVLRRVFGSLVLGVGVYTGAVAFVQGQGRWFKSDPGSVEARGRVDHAVAGAGRLA
jgi:uncharacterized membrane protein YfcA